VNLEIKLRTPELVAVYFEFHEHRAFSEHAVWPHSCCLAFCMHITDDKEMTEEVKTNGGDREALYRVLKTRAEKYITDGALQSYALQRYCMFGGAVELD